MPVSPEPYTVALLAIQRTSDQRSRCGGVAMTRMRDSGGHHVVSDGCGTPHRHRARDESHSAARQPRRRALLVETVFWSYPLVWWIGGRLVPERVREATIAVTGWRRAAVALTLASLILLPGGHGALQASPRVTADEGAQVAAPPSGDAAAAFDAASVKTNKSGLPSGQDQIHARGYTATNLSLEVFIRLAYEISPRSRGLEPFEVIGGPSWLRSARFDINATAGREVSVTEVRSMLRTLLADRFQLKAHIERRQGPVFQMSLLRPGQLGPQLRPTAADCGAVSFDPFRGITPGEASPCGYFGPSPTALITSDRAYQALRGMTMTDFASAIYPYLGRRVIDATGLSGYFDGEFEFTAEIVMPPPPSGPNPFDGRTLPSIYSVLPQQLGLKLERANAPIDVLVIDSADFPSEN